MPEKRPWIVTACFMAAIGVVALLGFYGTKIAARRNYGDFASTLYVGMPRSRVVELEKMSGGTSDGIVPPDVPASVARDPHTLLVWFHLGSIDFKDTTKLVIITFNAHDAIRGWKIEG